MVTSDTRNMSALFNYVPRGQSHRGGRDTQIEETDK